MAKTTEIEVRTLILGPTEVRAVRSDDGAMMIGGYAAKYMRFSQDLGGFREQIHPEFFKNALSRCDVRCLRNHDPDLLLGRSGNGTLRLRSDETGLYYENDLPETQAGRDTYELVRSGRMQGCSFSFTVDRDGDDWSDDGSERTLMSCRDLYDVGPVTWPAYLDTDVAARSLERHRLAKTPPNPGVRVPQIRLLRLRLSQHTKG